jgi:hypothetical protein
MKNKIKYILTFLFVAFIHCVNAQNFGDLRNEEPFEISGSFSLGTSFYSTSRESTFRAPFSYIINGAPTISIYGIKIPLSISYSDKQLSNTKPFQRYGSSPNYKWIKLHLGHRSLDFSAYSMAGQTFLGAGVELTPKKLQFLAFYGKFENIFATRNPFELGVLPTETYKRTGYGLKVGYKGEKGGLNLSLLKIEDLSKSENIQLTDSLSVKPKENIVISPSIYFTLLKKLTIQSTVSASALTHNKQANVGFLDDDIVNQFSSILTINQSTKIAFAGDVSGSLDFKNFGIGLKYQRIEPLYESLGLYGITNDFENYTANASVSLFKNRVQLSATQGYQKNNLKNIRQVTNTRNIGSYNLNLSLKKGFNINAQYSNFQTDQEAGYVEVNDTIRLALVSKNGSINTSYRWKQKELQHSVSLFVSTQDFKDLNSLNSFSFDNQSTSSSLNYRLKMKPINLSLRGGLNYTTYESNDQLTNRVGVSLRASKKLVEQNLKLKLGLSVQKSEVNKLNDGVVFKGHIGLSQKLDENNTISLRASLIDRNSLIKEAFTDYRGRFSYTYKF